MVVKSTDLGSILYFCVSKTEQERVGEGISRLLERQGQDTEEPRKSEVDIQSLGR